MQDLMSSGHPKLAKQKATELRNAFLNLGSGLSVVMDASQCVQEMQLHGYGTCALVYVPCLHCLVGSVATDLTEFIHDKVLHKLDFKKTDEVVAVHAPCSTKRMGLEKKMVAIAHGMYICFS